MDIQCNKCRIDHKTKNYIFRIIFDIKCDSFLSPTVFDGILKKSRTIILSHYSSPSSLSLFLSVSLPVCLSISVFLRISVSLCLYPSLSLSLSLPDLPSALRTGSGSYRPWTHCRCPPRRARRTLWGPRPPRSRQRSLQRSRTLCQRLYFIKKCLGIKFLLYKSGHR